MQYVPTRLNTVHVHLLITFPVSNPYMHGIGIGVGEKGTKGI